MVGLIRQASDLIGSSQIVTLRKISVGKAECHLLFAGARLPSALVELLCQIKFMHIKEDIGGLDQVLGRGGRCLANSRFGEPKGNLLFGVIKFTVAGEQSGEGKADINAIGIGSIQRASETRDGSIAFAE